MVVKITKDNFEEVVLKSDKKVLVDFYADWCGPCKMQSPIIDALAEELDHVTFAKLNVDEEMELAIRYQAMSIPMLLVFDQGQVVAKTVGLSDKEEILKLIG